MSLRKMTQIKIITNKRCLSSVFYNSRFKIRQLSKIKAKIFSTQRRKDAKAQRFIDYLAEKSRAEKK